VAICAHHQLNYIKTPRFPPPPILDLPTAPHIALLSRTHSNARHSPVVLHFTATCLIARPTSVAIAALSPITALRLNVRRAVAAVVFWLGFWFWWEHAQSTPPWLQSFRHQPHTLLRAPVE
jgi:hypothetical protein